MAVPGTEHRSLWLGAADGDDSQRSLDEVRIINEMTAQEVETFLATNPVDMGAANQLRREPTHVALAVIERGPLRSCRDPSGVMVARIRDAKAGKLGPAPTNNNSQGQQAQSSPPPLPPPQPVDPNASDVDKFLLINRIDQAGAIALKSEPPEVQRLCMSKGTLLNSTNPSASLVARIRLCKEPGAVGLTPPPPPASLTALGDGSVPFMQPPPPLSLEDRGDLMAGEAAKAIAKLEQAQFGQPVPTPPPAPVLTGEIRQEWPQAAEEPANKRQNTNGSEPIQNIGDKSLQDEALRAIQGLNQAGIDPTEL